ncbi:hypothetical protein [Flexibacterium corallicola]|uniref:hypothetical protein n=1 Tax=Flexibacterium corallicola TaxID=3037259 RepID=UPI00286EEBD8|nr:hypothetical protein [Pseudovibrio sp. M1P-2-3]
MSKSAFQIAEELTAGAERARVAGDAVASIALAVKAAEYLQLAKLLGDSIATTEKQQSNEARNANHT